MRQWLAESYPDAVVADGHDGSIAGVLVRPGQPPVVLYDGDRLVQDMVTEGMSWDEASEYAEFNVFCAYYGTSTPVYVRFLSPFWGVDTNPQTV